MSLRQLVMQLDRSLKDVFNDESLEQKEWFSKMEEIVKTNAPRRYRDYEPSAVVLAYVKWKYFSERTYK